MRRMQQPWLLATLLITTSIDAVHRLREHAGEIRTGQLVGLAEAYQEAVYLGYVRSLKMLSEDTDCAFKLPADGHVPPVPMAGDSPAPIYAAPISLVPAAPFGPGLGYIVWNGCPSLADSVRSRKLRACWEGSCGTALSRASCACTAQWRRAANLAAAAAVLFWRRSCSELRRGRRRA